MNRIPAIFDGLCFNFLAINVVLEHTVLRPIFVMNCSVFLCLLIVALLLFRLKLCYFDVVWTSWTTSHTTCSTSFWLVTLLWICCTGSVFSGFVVQLVVQQIRNR